MWGGLFAGFSVRWAESLPHVQEWTAGTLKMV